MQTNFSSICVFCGSKSGKDTSYGEDAEAFGALLAQNNIRLVYGGGDAGLMGRVAKGTREAGGHVTGIIPDFLIENESLKSSLDLLDEVIITKNMHERKMHMFDKSDGFVALPGGIGTLEELVEQMTWSQLGQHQKPVVVANFGDFWSPLFNLINHMIDQSFIDNTHPVHYGRADKADQIIPALFETAGRLERAGHALASDIKSQM